MNFLLKAWEWLNGKKVALGALIDLLSAIALAFQTLLPAFGVEAALAASIVAKIIIAVGFLHRIAKYLGWE